MAFKDTLLAVKKKHKLPNGKIAIVMNVSCSQVYRYLDGTSEPKWGNVLLLLGFLGYEVKIGKKDHEGLDLPPKV